MGGLYNYINSNLYHYAGNNPVKYTDPDGNEISAVVQNPSFWTGIGIILGTVAEDIATFGAGIADDPATLAIGTGLILGACGITSYAKNIVVSRTITDVDSKAKEKISEEKLMYHYTTVSPDKWVGPLAPGNYITPNGNYSSVEADNKLALPKDKYGNDRIPTYKYTFKVKEGEYTTAPNSLLGNIVAPLNGKDGGGIEFINTVPLIPLNCEHID